jgi:hypothetical protein
MARSKYRNRKCEAFGIQFDSEAERDRFYELRELQQCGFIDKLECHPSFVLLPAFKDCMGKKERAITYKADFQYIALNDGRKVVEDVKSKATSKARDWSLRKKLFKHRFPEIWLREVMA